MEPDVATREAAYSLEYPFSSIGGIKRAPIAAAAAIAEPVTAAKIIDDTTTTIPRPPGQWPTTDSEKSVIRREIPPTAIRFPASMKSGIAMNAKLLTPPYICCTMTCKGSWVPQRPMKLTMPREKAMGTLKRKTTKSPTIQTTAGSPAFPQDIVILFISKIFQLLNQIQHDTYYHKKNC